MPDKVVFDTNVIISGLLWRGNAYRCLLLARSGVVQAVHCAEMLAELTGKLQHKFGFSADRVQAVINDWKSYALEVQIKGQLHVIADDPDDDMFIECALAAGAKVIVSGDHHLLDLAGYEDVEILCPSAFLSRIADKY